MSIRSIFITFITFGIIGISFGQETKPKQAVRGYIKAEVQGLLVWKDSRYHVVVRPQEDPKKELVFDLWISENKVLVRQLEKLQDKQVVVTGKMVWVPKGAQVNSDDDFTLGFQQFGIKQVEEK